MERQNLLNERNIRIVLIILYSVGIIGHGYQPLYPYMIMLTPVTLLITGLLVLYSAVTRAGDSKLYLWCGAVLVTTFLLEAVGVATGWIFGAYYYGPALGWKLLNVPLIIGFNWMLVLLGAAAISLRFFDRPFSIGLSAAVLAVIFDFVMEPMAMRLGYWQWMKGEVPTQNYAAWGVFSFFAAYFFARLDIKRPNGRMAEEYFAIQFAFFCMLNILFV